MQRHRPNLALLVSISLLIIIGSVMISSASVVLSQQNASDPNFYFKQHLLSLLPGLILFLVAYKIDYHFWKKLAPLAILGSLFLLILVFIPGIGSAHGTFARRWIDIGPINFAPTEIFKLSLIIYLAAFFESRGEDIKSFATSALPFLLILAAAAGLIIAQPDMGTLMVVSVISVAMYFIAGASYSHIGILGLLGLGGVMFMIKTAPYRMERFMIFLNPNADQSGAGYQINQALLAVGTGGLFGLGFGQSRQKFNYLPEASTDSVFAITAEEIGFIRILFILLAYFVIAFYGYRLASRVDDKFARLLAVGITTWIVAQALINIGANLSLVPLTGVPLPFISMGSSSTVMLMTASGILLNISATTQGETRESRSNRRRNWWSYLTGSSRN